MELQTYKYIHKCCLQLNLYYVFNALAFLLCLCQEQLEVLLDIDPE